MKNYKNKKLILLIILLLSFNLVFSSNIKKDKFVWGIWYNCYDTNYYEDINDENKSKNIIRSHLTFFKRIGINRIYFLVKFTTGEVFYQSSLKDVKPFKNIKWDPFKFICNECKRLKLEIHPYVNIFSEGGDKLGPYLKKYPIYALKDKNGRKYGWASPIIKEVRDRMKNILKEIVVNYDIDGIQYDRIRYPNDMVGYGFILNQFKKQYKREPYDSYKDDYVWIYFRQSLITSFIRESNFIIKNSKKNIIISAAVFPRINSAQLIQLQPWGRWCRLKLFDEIVTMDYFEDMWGFKFFVKEAVNEVKNTPVSLLIGIGSYIVNKPNLNRKVQLNILDKQINFIINNKDKYKIKGIVFFNGFDLLREDICKIISKYINKIK